MGAPKIKVYQLPRGYSEDGDNDVQQVVDDELLPVVDKPLTPEDFYQLVGVKWFASGQLYPVLYTAGAYMDSLTPDGASFQYPSSEPTDIFTLSQSVFSPVVLDDELSTIDPSGYTVSASGIYFLGVPPSGATILYWRSATEPCTHFATVGPSGLYDGNNNMFNSVHVYVGGTYVDPSGYTVVRPSGLVIFNESVSAVTANYTYTTSTTQYFIGKRENWVDNHMYMRPDIFKGMFDYPGDDSEDSQGNPITQGAIPQFVDNSAYQLDFRKGLVTFAEEFDSSLLPVYASFAYLVNVRNVTGQVLDQVTADPSGVGYVYKAVSDTKFPLSINASWIKRNDTYTPRNFYVNGEQKPQLITVTPYDVLTVKNA